MNSHNKTVPALRFPEFNDEWKTMKTSEIFKNHSNKSHSGDLPVLAITQDRGTILRSDLDKDIFSSDTSVNSYKVVEVGDFVISLRSFQGGIEYSNVRGICSPAYTVLKPKIEIVDLFFKEYLKKDDFIQRLSSTVVGIREGKQISYDAFSTLTITFPTIPEQRKIAAFLTAVDERIQQLTKKKALLEKYKKGVMQQLFNQDIRFTDDNGNEFADWEEKQIIDFAPLQRGFDLPVDEIIEGEYPVVFSNGILKTHNEYKAKAPGVVTGRSGTIGKVTYVEKDYWPHNTALWVTDFKGNYPKYIFYFYVSFKLERFGTGSGVPTLNRNDVHNQRVFIPSTPEQRKIANFLSAIDYKLTFLDEQLRKTQTYKKGLLQKMFV